jgi:hypothetical protein
VKYKSSFMIRKPLKRKTRLRQVSKKRAIQNSVYRVLRESYLVENPFCYICGKNSCDIHHKRGRFGERLNDVNYFMAVCRSCHQWIHSNPKEAYAKDYLIKR